MAKRRVTGSLEQTFLREGKEAEREFLFSSNGKKGKGGNPTGEHNDYPSAEKKTELPDS